MAFAFLGVKVAALLLIYAVRAVVATAFFAWRRPWAFFFCAALLPIALALPEYIA